MGKLLIIEPAAPTSVIARGTSAGNLATPDPKEVWVDSAAAGAAVIAIDLGAPLAIDTIYLGSLRQAAAAATWTIEGGVANGNEFVIQAASSLRVPDVAGRFAATSHALWYGNSVTVRYLRLSIAQPGGAPALSAGNLVIGAAFAPQLGREWGFGRTPIDTGSSTALPAGGFAIVEGVRKRSLSWTFGDLSIEEADRLELLALALGETAPVLVVEDPTRSAGLVSRIHYSKFGKWKPFERRNRAQTRWEISVEDWV